MYSRYTQAILNVKHSFLFDDTDRADKELYKKSNYIQKDDDLIEPTNERETSLENSAAFYNDENTFKRQYTEDNPQNMVITRSSENSNEEKRNTIIKLENVGFKYECKTVLENVSISIYQNEKIAIIGENGGGKSTLIKLLMKFDNYTGNIYINCKNIAEIEEKEYRNLIGFVPQTSFLFNNTIKFNILFGVPYVNSEEVDELAEKVKLKANIDSMKQGYETVVGERGKNLSGGERQKILIMRAILKNTPIMLLDEPTSAIDKESEIEIFGLLSSIDRTIITILHNLELVTLFDRILIVKDKNLIQLDGLRNMELEEAKHMIKEIQEKCK